MLYREHMVLSCREQGLPLLRVAPLQKMAIAPEVNAHSRTLSRVIKVRRDMSCHFVGRNLITWIFEHCV
jgi:hypothetical protein